MPPVRNQRGTPVSNSQQAGKNPFVKKVSLFKYGPSAEDVNETLWGHRAGHPKEFRFSGYK